MKISEQEFQMYLKAAPPVIWAWIYGELKDGKAKSAFYTFLFDETAHLRNLSTPWMKTEFLDLVSQYPEVKTVANRAATNYYIRHSWRKWLPWNWNK